MEINTGKTKIMVMIATICTIICLVVMISMVQFSSKGLSSRAATNYTLQEFNGVDYTTTPTKVTDDKAIKISNYLPEGNSLVKRYGYEKIMDLIYDNVADIAAPISYNGNTYTIDQTVNSFRLIKFNDFLLLFCGRGLSDGTVLANNIVFFTTDNTQNLKVRSILKQGRSNNVRAVARGYKCDTGVINIANNTIYAFVFGEYYIIKYTSNNLFIITRVTGGDGGWTYDSEHDTWSYLGSSNEAFIFKEYIGLNNDYHFQVGTSQDGETVYTPTLALNFQPSNANGKVVAFQQINMLNPLFIIEFGITLKLETTNNVNTYEIVEPLYEIKNLFGGAIDYDKVYPFENFFTLVENIDDVQGYPIGFEKEENGIKTTISDTKANVYNYQKKLLIEAKNDEYCYVKVPVQFRIYPYSYYDIFSAKVGCVFGVNNSADRMFVGNTDNAPNTDWHTLNDANGVPDFTYIGTDTYNAIGSSGSQIVGYSLLNDGSMAIFKEPNDVSNIFIRTGKISNTTEQYTTTNYATGTTTTYNYVRSEELYPTVASGLLIKSINKDTKFVLYDNKLIFNTEDGIYYLNLNATTSNQSYSAKELSYYIRNDLGKDIAGSSIFTDGKYLYVSRKDKNGQFRVYVADKNKYGFVNAEEQYHWWVLDNIPVMEMFIFNKETYFLSNDYSIYLLNTNKFTDYDYKKTTSVTIGTTVISTDVAFDTEEDKMIIATNSTSWQKLLDIYKYNASIDKDNIGEKLNYIKKNVYLKITTDTQDKEKYGMFLFNNLINNPESNIMRFRVSNDDTQKYINIIDKIKLEELEILNNNTVYKISDYDVEYDGEYNYINLELSLISSNQSNIISGNTYLLLNNQELVIEELYTNDDKALSDYFYIPGTGWCNSQTGEFVATNLNFNRVKFSYQKIDVDFFSPSSNFLTGVTFVINAPVEAYWYGKYTDLGRYDILKTTKSIHFVPETRRGGYTEVGYRTRKSRSMVSDTTSTYTLSKYIIDIAKERTTLSRYFVSNDLGINLSDIDFNNFSFESDVFARTYSSKKKIKNFSFIQLKFASDTAEDSTIASVDIKYTYGRDNKGVK